jgi:hypothetical protein
VITFLSELRSLDRIIVTEHIGATEENYATCRMQQSKLIILLCLIKIFLKYFTTFTYTQEKLIL